jgi:allantoinase
MPSRTHRKTRLDLVVRATRGIGADGERPMSVGVRDGRIVTVGAVDADVEADREVTLGADEVLLPGLVDTHVHVNDPGRAHWEGFDSATRAAAAGGVTTIIDMPLNSIPPTIDVPALESKRAAARGRVHVDVGFWGGAVPANLAHLRPLYDAGVFGFKAFLVDSGVEEFPALTTAQLGTTMKALTEVDALLVVHAEDPGVLASSPAAHGDRYRDFLASRPPSSERAAVQTVLGLAEQTGVRAHVVHLSSVASLPALSDARGRGVRVSAETCPHYLVLAAEEIADGDTSSKCCPPIRDQANQDALWRGLRDGTISSVVSDHSPCPADLKCPDTGDFGAAWGGIASLQLGLPLVWTAARDRGVDLAEVVRWMATEPAGLAGLAGKGRIVEGADADLCVFAPEETWAVDARSLHHRHPVTPYEGRNLRGVVRETWLRGEQVTGRRPGGRLLSRTDR